MKKEIKTVTWICDICGAECIPVGSRKHTTQFIQGDPVGVIISFAVFGYQVQLNEACVCTKCAITTMKGIIKQLELTS